MCKTRPVHHQLTLQGAFLLPLFLQSRLPSFLHPLQKQLLWPLSMDLSSVQATSLNAVPKTQILSFYLWIKSYHLPF